MKWEYTSLTTHSSPQELIVPAGERRILFEDGSGFSSGERRTTIRCEAGASLVFAFALASSGSIRRSITLMLQQDAHAELLGFVTGTGKGECELRLHEDHGGRGSWARTTVRGILYDHAHLDLHGHISIRPNAARSDGLFDGRIILSGRDARAEVFPSLEIEAQDVKATHAATVGPFDPEQVFYCQTRGCTIDGARTLILGGFLDTLIERIPAPENEHIRSQWHHLLHS